MFAMMNKCVSPVGKKLLRLWFSRPIVNIDVLNAQQQLFSTKRDLSKARYDTLVNGLKLKAAAGSLSEEDVAAVNRLLGE